MKQWKLYVIILIFLGLLVFPVVAVENGKIAYEQNGGI
jgi:hypothetical protein